MSHHYIHIENLSHRYPQSGEQQALSQINLAIDHGEAIGLIGANGAGKSTLLQHINGILLPQQGSVVIGGTPVVAGTLPEIRRRVGMVFQDADAQLFMPTVFDDVAFGLINQGLPMAAVSQQVDAVLDRFGCGHLSTRPPFQLSGGEKRKVTLAAILALSPDILLMDEPTANLDARARRECAALIAGFAHTRIIATHDMDLVAEVCTRVVLLHEGKIVADAPPAELFRQTEMLERCHVEPPLRMQACPFCSSGESK